MMQKCSGFLLLQTVGAKDLGEVNSQQLSRKTQGKDLISGSEPHRAFKVGLATIELDRPVVLTGSLSLSLWKLGVLL